MPIKINRSCKNIWCLLLRDLNYLLITFSRRIMIPSIHLNLRSGCLKMVNPIGIFENSNPKKKKKKTPANINNLKTIFQEEWYKIPTNYCKKLIENYRKRLEAFEVNKGYSTKNQMKIMRYFLYSTIIFSHENE